MNTKAYIKYLFKTILKGLGTTILLIGYSGIGLADNPVQSISSCVKTDDMINCAKFNQDGSVEITETNETNDNLEY